ncbi:Outer membrane efflux protein [Anatilimnocola aggregata]|uniref:Outer membrane efflux protein n=1 Tax=Anatilimnocola aggregata TaxID=2528021 RepID=A0A517Y6Q4_9BACT|nr:TolC family protein [Anatilimnocola aggregata]QDU25909.1 Outer membrane efflux protein [Anatilimnocola aggregata]
MTRHNQSWRWVLVGMLLALSGCHPTQPFYLHDDGDLSHYIGKATQQETPDLQQAPLADAALSHAPFTLSNPEYKEIWELSLEEVVSISLANTKLIRGGQPVRLQNGTLFAGTQEGNLLQLGTRSFASIYSPAIQESNPGFQNDGATVDGGVNNSQLGVEAALSAFDAQLSIVGNGPGGANAFLNYTDRPRNIASANPTFPFITKTVDGGLTSSISKQSAEGTTYTVRNNTAYNRGFNFGQNVQPLVSTWTTTMEVEARHPLLRGRGTLINRMPVVIARIGNDIEILNLQGQLQDMLNNIEVRYWDLYLSYRNLETAKVGRDSALITWRIVYAKYKGGVEDLQAEAQAREQYYAFRAQVETALRELYNNENELRLLMGLAATDGRLIRPKDDPNLARVNFDWTEIMAESIARRPELISKRWEIKQRELELILARNRLLPQLDVGGVYRWVGLGDDLINADRNGLNFPAPGSTAVDELTEGNYQEWGLFGSFTMPIGFRRELAGVRHAQLRLAREKASLDDMELDVNVGLSKAVRNLDANYQLAQTNANRWVAAQTEVEVVQNQYELDKVTLDLVLEAQRRRAQAQNAFWVSVAEYNKSIADLHTRKGSILEYNGISMEEGPWPEKAYFDALQRARERDAGIYFDYGWTRPSVISRGETPNSSGALHSTTMEGMPSEVGFEELPGSSRVQAIETGSSQDAAPMMQADPAPTIESVPALPPASLPAQPNLGDATSVQPATGKTGNPLRGAATASLRRETASVKSAVANSPAAKTDANVSPAGYTQANSDAAPNYEAYFRGQDTIADKN